MCVNRSCFQIDNYHYWLPQSLAGSCSHHHLWRRSVATIVRPQVWTCPWRPGRGGCRLLVMVFSFLSLMMRHSAGLWGWQGVRRRGPKPTYTNLQVLQSFRYEQTNVKRDRELASCSNAKRLLVFLSQFSPWLVPALRGWQGVQHPRAQAAEGPKSRYINLRVLQSIRYEQTNMKRDRELVVPRRSLTFLAFFLSFHNDP